MTVNEIGLACDNCVQAIANDDYTGIDYYLSAEESEKRMNEIQAAIAQFKGHLVIGESVGFSWRGCDVCGDRSGGDKHEVSELV